MGCIVLGVVLILFGTRLFFQPVWFNPKYSTWFDFSGYNIPFGGFCILIWVAIYLVGNKKTSKRKKEKGR